MTESKGGLGATLRRTATVARVAKATWDLRRSKEPDARDRAQQALASVLANARGLPMKVGQFLATTSGAQPLQPLWEGIPPQPLETMLPVLAAGLKRPVEEVFAQVEPSQAAASLGQVHRATLHDGRVVAVKLQYPDIARAIDAEMRLMGLLPGVGRLKAWGFDLDAYKRELRDNLERELDYLQEAHTQQAFGEAAQVEGLVVPKVLLGYCSRQVLVQEWVDGVHLPETTAWSKKERLQIAQTLLKTAFQSMFRVGILHGDPHHGNTLFARHQARRPTVSLLDFGCTMQIERRARLAFLKLLMASRDRLPVDPFDCFVEMGFDANRLSQLRAQLPALCLILFEPFLQNRVVRPVQWQAGERIQALLGEERWWFRSSAPPDSLFLIRAFQGLLVQLEELGVGLPWWPLLTQAVGQDVLEEASAFTPDKSEGAIDLRQTFARFARVLKVEIYEGKERTKQLSIPAAEISSLTALIPEEVQAHILAAGYDIQAREEEARACTTFPFTLFDITEGQRRYHIWLER